MSIRFTTKARRGMVALTVAAGLALGVAGCGGGGDDDKKPDASASASKSGGSNPSAQEGQSDEPLAEVKGPNGLDLKITSAKRDSGGFVTVNGELKNDGSEAAVLSSQLTGNETEIMKNGQSFGGATLVDAKGKKRYYVLRDTDGRPLTTTGVQDVKAGDTISIFMQFPAPPASTTEVDFQLPTFSTASIKISG
jgi:basic membrane lipoprotein Med (substrate-binding protein (PBP1-ABC) superfamily)